MANDQLQVLNALDVAKTQWYHFTAIVIAGMGFFTDAYDLFCISLVTKLLGRLYYTHPGSDHPGTLPADVSAAVNGVAFVGTLSGHLFFGWLGDKMGRKKVYGMTLMLMVLCSIGSGLSFGHTSKGILMMGAVYKQVATPVEPPIFERQELLITQMSQTFKMQFNLPQILKLYK